MPFSPAIEVIVEQPRELQPPDLSFAALLERFPGLAEADAVAITGSVQAGWGNVFSDVDIYVFSDRELELPEDPSVELWPASDPCGISWMRWVGRYGDACVDMAIFPTDSLPTALKPFLRDDEPELCGLSREAEDFVYRIWIARPLKGADFFERQKQMIRDSSYRRVLARKHKILAENALTDVAGQLDAGDVASARVTARLAADLAADSCLLLAGELCRRHKWLMRRIEATPECGITPDAYRSEVLSGPRPGESEYACALRVARWAQANLVRVEDAVLSKG